MDGLIMLQLFGNKINIQLMYNELSDINRVKVKFIDF